MKNMEQLVNDMRNDAELRQKIRYGLNKLRSDENLEVYEAGLRVARDLGYEILGKNEYSVKIDEQSKKQLTPKISDFLDIFKAQSYPKLFSKECIKALTNIRNEYGNRASHYAIYEVSLNDTKLTTDFSCKLYDRLFQECWFEFDFNLYGNGDVSHCTFLEALIPSEKEIMLRNLIGDEKFEILSQPLNNLYTLLKSKGLSIVYIGTLDNRGYSQSVRIETRVRSGDKLLKLIRELSYDGDISLIENTISKIRPYIRDEVFLFSFDLFADRISDKIGISILPFSSIKGTEKLITFLLENNLCLLGKGQDLIKWKRDELPNGLLVQDINFIKFQFMNKNISAVKAYLIQSDHFPFYLS